MAAGAEAFKIVIVGGGPAGLAAALHIVHRMPSMAREMVILESAEYPRPKLCGGGVTVHGTSQLERLGLKLDTPAYPIHQLRFVLGERTFNVASPNVMYVIQRHEFDAALAEAVIERGLNLRTSESVIDILPNDSGVEIITERRRYQATVLIAADGAKSTVRRKLRLKSADGIARLLRVMTPQHDRERGQTNTAEFDFSCVQHGVQGYVWHFPCVVDGQPWMNRGIFDSRVAPAAERPTRRNVLKNTFADNLAEQNVDIEMIQLEGHPVRWFNRHSTFAKPHILLVGDAAGVDPLFAEGISFAMEYGELAAKIVQEAFAKNDFTFADYPARLVSSPMGRLLQRRLFVARNLYQYRWPIFWALFWRLAAVAPPPLQRVFGASLGLLN